MEKPADRSPADPRVDTRRVKLAANVAERIIEDVIAMGWPVGTVLGSESELVERYGVGRSILREGARIVEAQHVARMRRGPGGGLVVEEPDVAAVIAAATLYLLRIEAPLGEVFEARIVLEEIVAELAPGRMDESDIQGVREILDTEANGEPVDRRRLHSLLAKASGNPVLDLFVECLSQFANFYFHDRSVLSTDTLGDATHAHRQIAAAVTSNEPGLARRRMTRHLQAEADYIHEHLPRSAKLDPEVALAAVSETKRGAVLANEIFVRIVLDAIAPGTLIGSEAEMLDRHNTSRTTFREAVRILEHHSIVTMRRGPHGGLFATEPQPSAVAEIVALYLRRHLVSADHISEVRAGVEIALVSRTSERLDDDGRRRLREAIDNEARIGPFAANARGEDVHTVLASLSGNKVLELVARVLLRLSGNEAGSLDREATLTAHRTMVDALCDGDRDLALHRARRHVADLTPATSANSSHYL